jgi:hypothetical protein
MHYQLTIFNRDREIVSISIFAEYPTNVELAAGQWLDICRIPIADYEFLDHILFSEELCLV